MTSWFAFCLLMLCFQVILLAESQGGQVASKLAPLVLPDFLVLLASLPDDPDITPLRNAHVQTVIGWKVGNHFTLIKPNIPMCAGRRAPLGGTGRRGAGGKGSWPDSLHGWRAQRFPRWPQLLQA